VFYNLFFEAEPFAAMLTAQNAHSTHGHSQKFVLHFGRTKRPENASKSRLVPVSRFDLTEPLDATGDPVI